MQQQGYFKRSWAALTQDSSWWKIMLIYTLVLCVPVIGMIIVYGYLLLWAKEAAWGIERPLPKKMGDLGPVIKTGAIAYLGIFVAGMVISIVVGALGAIPVLGVPFSIIGGVATILGYVLLFVVIMRATIYDAIEPLVQFQQPWDMIKRDFGGLVKIAVIYLIFIAIIAAIAIAYTIALTMGLLAWCPTLVEATSAEAVYAMLVPAIPVILLSFVVLLLVCNFIMTIGLAVVFRAMGYWTAQFEPAKWGPSTAPLPANVGPQPQPVNYGNPPQGF